MQSFNNAVGKTEWAYASEGGLSVCRAEGSLGQRSNVYEVGKNKKNGAVSSDSAPFKGLNGDKVSWFMAGRSVPS